MAYVHLPESALRAYCEAIFARRGYAASDSAAIVDVLLTADLYGIESHGVQRLIRYHLAIEEGSIQPDAPVSVVFETPLSAVIDAPRSMGQIVAIRAMQMAIAKARSHGFGAVAVRGTNHFGIAGYYTSLAARQDLLGLCLTNTEAIAVPTHGKQAMLGTSPIALCMPADPVPFWYDAATTVVTRGKLEVHNKKEMALPAGWAADENGQDCLDARHVLENIIGKRGGGIFPLGGRLEETGSHKGYGLGLIVELLTAIFAGGTTAPHVRNSGNADTSFCCWAIDYGLFGDKADIRGRMSTLLQELRDSPKADGCARIYTHGEKEFESVEQIRRSGIPVNDKTLAELRQIGAQLGLSFADYFTP